MWFIPANSNTRSRCCCLKNAGLDMIVDDRRLDSCPFLFTRRGQQGAYNNKKTNEKFNENYQNTIGIVCF